jgi:hypothetical protein
MCALLIVVQYQLQLLFVQQEGAVDRQNGQELAGSGHTEAKGCTKRGACDEHDK